MFRKFVCIYLIVYRLIGSNGPLPLPKYYALPIASLDFIVCIYCYVSYMKENPLVAKRKKVNIKGI